MKASLALLLAPALLPACVARTLDAGSSFRDGAASSDLGPGDLASPPYCTPLGVFDPSKVVLAFNDSPSTNPSYAWDDYLEGVRDAGHGLIDILYYEYFQPLDPGVSAVVPHAAMLEDGSDESLALLLGAAPDGSVPGKTYFAESGDVTVTAVDDTHPTGRIAVAGTNVVLTELHANGQRDPAGPCVAIASFNLSTTYGSSP